MFKVQGTNDKECRTKTFPLHKKIPRYFSLIFVSLTASSHNKVTLVGLYPWRKNPVNASTHISVLNKNILNESRFNRGNIGRNNRIFKRLIGQIRIYVRFGRKSRKKKDHRFIVSTVFWLLRALGASMR